jgi:hypothetical protein
MAFQNERSPHREGGRLFCESASLLVMRVVRVMRVMRVVRAMRVVRVMRVIRVLRVVLKIIKLIKNAIHLTLSLITFVLLVFGRIPVNSPHFSLYFVCILSPKYYILKVLIAVLISEIVLLTNRSKLLN